MSLSQISIKYAEEKTRIGPWIVEHKVCGAKSPTAEPDLAVVSDHHLIIL